MYKLTITNLETNKVEVEETTDAIIGAIHMNELDDMEKRRGGSTTCNLRQSRLRSRGEHSTYGGQGSRRHFESRSCCRFVQETQSV